MGAGWGGRLGDVVRRVIVFNQAHETGAQTLARKVHLHPSILPPGYRSYHTLQRCNPYVRRRRSVVLRKGNGD